MAARQKPLKVLLPTLGSFGDVHPVVAVAQLLQRRGHRAVLVSNEIYTELAEQTGIGFMPLGTLTEGEAAVADSRIWHPRRGLQAIVEHAIEPNIARLYELIKREAGPDTVVVASSLCFGARIAQEKLGVPTASMHLQPTLFRSIYEPGKPGRGAFFPDWLPRSIVKGAFHLLDRLWVDRVLGASVNEFRAQLGMTPIKHILSGWIHSPQLVIGLFPDWFAKPQPDWPPNTKLAGFVQYDRAEKPLPEDAEAFLRAGAPPIVFTPGSASAQMHDFFRESVHAVARLGLRAMLVARYPEQLPRELAAGIKHFEYLPFSQLLPRAAALVHHGGIGTVAQAIKGGIPQVLVPNSHDQPDNADRIAKLGLGTWMYPEQYRGRRVDRALERVLMDSEMRERCRRYSGLIDSEKSVETACDLIESLSQEPRRNTNFPSTAPVR